MSPLRSRGDGITERLFLREPCLFLCSLENSRFFTAKKKVLTKSLAAALLKNGRAPLKGCYSEKTGKTYDASVFLEDDGQRAGYKLVFDND